MAKTGVAMIQVNNVKFEWSDNWSRVMPCFVCTHAEASHCKSGVVHGRYRVPAGAVQRPEDVFRCMTRHCEEPLCSCTNFARTASLVVWPNRIHASYLEILVCGFCGHRWRGQPGEVCPSCGSSDVDRQQEAALDARV